MTPSSMKASATQLKESAQVLDESVAIHPKQQQYYLIMVLCLILKPSVTRDYPKLSISGVSGWNMNDISKLDMNPDAFTRRQVIQPRYGSLCDIFLRKLSEIKGLVKGNWEIIGIIFKFHEQIYLIVVSLAKDFGNHQDQQFNFSSAEPAEKTDQSQENIIKSFSSFRYLKEYNDCYAIASVISARKHNIDPRNLEIEKMTSKNVTSSAQDVQQLRKQHQYAAAAAPSRIARNAQKKLPADESAGSCAHSFSGFSGLTRSPSISSDHPSDRCRIDGKCKLHIESSLHKTMFKSTVPGVTKIGEFFHQTDQIGDFSCTTVQERKNGTAPERQGECDKMLCNHQIEDCSMQVGRIASTEENMISMTDKSRNKVFRINGLCSAHFINSQSLPGQLWICCPVFTKVFNVHELTPISEQQPTRQQQQPPQIQLQEGHALRVQAKADKCQETSRPEGAGLDTASADEAHDQDGLILKAAVRDRKVVHMKHLNEKDLVAEEVALDKVVNAGSNTTCSDSGAANEVQNVCRSGCVSTADSTKQEMFKLNKTTVILGVCDVSNRSSNRDNNQDSEVEDESLNMIGMCSSSPFQKSRVILLKYVHDKLLEHCNAENTKRLQGAEQDLPDYRKMVNTFANLCDTILIEDNGQQVYMDQKKESIEAEIIKCRLESDLERETRQIGGTATGQMFGNCKTVMLADMLSVSLCIVSARSSPTMQDQWVNISRGEANVVDAGDEVRDYWSSSVSNWLDVLVLHGKKEHWERTQKSVHTGQDLDDEDSGYPELDSSSEFFFVQIRMVLRATAPGLEGAVVKKSGALIAKIAQKCLLLEPTSGGEGEGAARRETRAHYYKRTAHRRGTRRGSGVSGEALGLASYADVPVPPGREPSRARTMAGRSRRRRWPLHGRHGRHGP